MPVVSKIIDVQRPSPVGSLVAQWTAGREEVAMGPKHAMAVPPCWEGWWGSWILCAVEAAKGAEGSNWSLELRVVEGGRADQLVLVSARHMMSMSCSCCKVMRWGVLSVVGEVPRPLTLLYQIRQVLGSLVVMSLPKKVWSVDVAKGLEGR